MAKKVKGKFVKDGVIDKIIIKILFGYLEKLMIMKET